MSSKKETAPRPAPTLQVRVFFENIQIGETEIQGGLNAMKGAK